MISAKLEYPESHNPEEKICQPCLKKTVQCNLSKYFFSMTSRALEASEIEFTSVSKITIILCCLFRFCKILFRLQQFHFSNFQLTSIKTKSRVLLKLTSKWRKLMMKLVKVSPVNYKTLDSPKSFTKLSFFGINAN